MSRSIHRRRLAECNVECKDENEANQAFREAMTLKSLQHTNVCCYKEFFVMWDKERSAMFVCIVMEYYPRGDLGHYLRCEREKGTVIPEEKIQNWLGQIICALVFVHKNKVIHRLVRLINQIISALVFVHENKVIHRLVRLINQIISALVFVHKNKVIHRDLKPSNIFKDGERIIIGDFGVATIIGDVRTKTRTAVVSVEKYGDVKTGSMNWMAPEVFDHAYDERSDIWSVGCILLEMVTCGFIARPEEIAGKLFEIKHNSKALDALMETVSQTYSFNLVIIIKDMLQRDFTARPTAVDIGERSYIKDCIAIYPNLVTVLKKKESIKSVERPIPIDQGIDAITDYLTDFIGHNNSVRKALYLLAHLTKEDGSSLSVVGKKVVSGVMKRYLHDDQILKLSLQIFRNIVPMANAGDTLFTPEICDVIITAMKENQENLEIQKSAVGLLMAMAADEAASQAIGHCGGITAVMTTMKLFSHQVDIVTPCCNALWTLAVCEDNARIMVEERCINDVANALDRHMHSVPLVTAASVTLMSLLLEEESMSVATQLNIVNLLLTAIDTHVTEAKVVRNACMTLAFIVEEDAETYCAEENAFKVLMNPQEEENKNNGLLIIMAAYEQHKDNGEVVENIVGLLKELVNYNEIRAEMKHLKIGEQVLAPISKHFKDNPLVVAVLAAMPASRSTAATAFIIQLLHTIRRCYLIPGNRWKLRWLPCGNMPKVQSKSNRQNRSASEIILPSQAVLTTLKYKPKTIGKPERIHRKKEQVDN
ncbi:hypothetical protein LSAT2_011360 [Lamellibrachia satsuma]|nr:hypothetical protein LSAT2_011360 [Lamellibrachia satsuma]